MSPETALQKALIETLSSAESVKALLGDPARIFDEPPSDAIFPYATIGRIDAQPNGAAFHDGLAHAVTLHVWSRHGGRAEAQAILAAFRAALDDTALSIEGRRVSLCLVTLVDSFRAGDGRTTQGVLRLKIHSEPA
jgi:hypothetical protein